MSIFLCRTCGKRVNRLQSKRIFENDDDILQKIELLTGIWLTDELNVPDIICSKCLLNLNHAIEFRTRCIKINHTFLMNRFKQFCVNSKKSLDDPLANEDIELENTEDAFELELNNMLCDETSLSRDSEEHRSSSVDEKEQSFTEQTIYIEAAAESRRRNSSLTGSKTKNAKNLICDQCGRHFNDRANFKRHLQRHLGVKNFACQECDYKDYSQHFVNLHTRIQHRGEQPYACKYCDKRFKNSMARLRHQRTHVEHLALEFKVAAFTCSLCEKRFVNKSTLDKHAIVHTGEQPFYCEICCIYFNRKSSLRTHYRSRTHQNKATSKLDETGVESD